jgi:hypothetical protein
MVRDLGAVDEDGRDFKSEDRDNLRAGGAYSQ